jgi:hypothetical protein
MAFKSGGRKCKFESLENRQMMAGDVVGSVHAGTLVLKGDNFSNGITITAGLNPHEVLVTGITIEGTPTNLNGISNGAVTFVNVIHGLKIKMGAGNDTVSISNLSVNGLTNINTGPGVDTVVIEQSTLCKGLLLKTGRDADDVRIADSTIQGKAIIKTAGDCDHVTLEDSVFGELDVNLGADNDSLSISHVSVITRTSLDGGTGINTFDEGISNFFGGFYDKKRLSG